MNDNILLKLSLDAGEIMLASGAETPRVEDTMRRILSIGNSEGVEAIALSTLLMVSIPSKEQGSMTLTRRVEKRDLNFMKICEVNALSRRLVAGELTPEVATAFITDIRATPSYPLWIRILSYAIAAFGFCAMVNGSVLDSMVSVLTGGLTGTFVLLFRGQGVPYFLQSFIGGVIAGAFATIAKFLIPDLNLTTIIVGTIFPLLPGITITNAVRDIMEGNFISGTSKLMEACLLAVSIAGGVGLSFSLLPL